MPRNPFRQSQEPQCKSQEPQCKYKARLPVRGNSRAWAYLVAEPNLPPPKLLKDHHANCSAKVLLPVQVTRAMVNMEDEVARHRKTMFRLEAVRVRGPSAAPEEYICSRQGAK